MRKMWARYLSDPQVAFLLLFLLLGVAVVTLAGDILAPLLVALVIAYVLDGGISLLSRRGMPRIWSLVVIYFGFLVTVAVVIFGVSPLLSQQVSSFLQDLPQLVVRGQEVLMQLPDKYPEHISSGHVQRMIDSFKAEITSLAQKGLSLSLASLAGFITFLVYVVLVPLLIFFFLKDKDRLLAWFTRFLPKKENQSLTKAVWADVNSGVAGYIRGKLIEIVIIWAISWLVFELLGLNYAALLSFLVGISVVIPYIGAAVVTIPVAMVAYAQWGLDAQFVYVMVAYTVLQFVDGNVLVPLLFSEIVNLHPVAIIGAVLVFGGIWGIWGVFFAIPLATLVNAVLKAWPRYGSEERSAP